MNYAIGLDLGGTNIKYALVDEDGSILYESIKPTGADGSRELVINNLEDCVKEILTWANDKKLNILGVGIGTPGVIDNGLILGGAENLPDWESLPLGGILSRKLNIPVKIDNDANLMGLAEVRFGNAKGTSDAIFLTIGTGVGGAMVLNGKLYGGHRNRGAELGHVIVDVNGEKCSCGANGCLEAHASTSALIRDYKKAIKGTKKLKVEKIDGKLIVNRYLEKEEAAVNVMNRHFNYLAKGIAGFINVFSPQKIVIGGGISEAGDFYIENLRERTLRLAMKETSVFTQIEAAALGNKAGFLGAVALVFDYHEQLAKVNSLI
jgi:glucokinase